MKRYTLFIFLFIVTLNATAQKKQTAADSLKFEAAKKQLNTFFFALKTVGLDTIFNGKPVTVLAPDDQAFAKLPTGLLDSLLKPASEITFARQAALVWLLMGHIMPLKLMAKDIVKLIHKNNGQTIFTTISGIKLTAKINANRNILLTDERGNQYIVKQFDISNGSADIFIISSVILPKEKPKIILR